MEHAGETRQNGQTRRDIVVIGASAGGVTALSRLVAGLPANLPAALVVVQHVSPTSESVLPAILSRRGPLPATHAQDDDPLEPGHVYVAPPDHHVLLRPGFIEVVRGPKENGLRPAVDPLFRTAARAYGPRVIGVVLTGYLECGTVGLLSVKARGGLAVVQDPADAAVPDMPRTALQHVAVDHVVPIADLAPLLTRLVHEPAPPAPAHLPPELRSFEGDEPGPAAPVVCPLCQGRLSDAAYAGVHHYVCHVGHHFTPTSLGAEQSDAVERALWAATRALAESVSLSRRLADGASVEARRRFEQRAVEAEANAKLLREMLLHGHLPSPVDVKTLVPGRRG